MIRTNPWLLLCAFYELIRFDVAHTVCGRTDIRELVGKNASPGKQNQEAAATVIACVAVAASLYCKHVLCLQRSIATVRLLRRRGVAAELVIGYRAIPFLAHAWVEINGRTANDSPEYARRLCVLSRA